MIYSNKNHGTTYICTLNDLFYKPVIHQMISRNIVIQDSTNGLSINIITNISSG